MGAPHCFLSPLSLSSSFFLATYVSPFSFFTSASHHHPSHDVFSFSPNAFTLPHPPPPLPPPPAALNFSPVLERMGIVEENEAMADAFKVGHFDPKLADEVLANGTRTEDMVDEEKEEIRVRVQKYEFCDQKMSDYIPCLDNVEAIRGLNSTAKGDKF